MEMIEKKNSQLRVSLLQTNSILLMLYLKDDCAKEVARMQKVVDETNDLKRQAEIEARRQTEVSQEPIVGLEDFMQSFQASLVNMRAGGMPHGTVCIMVLISHRK